MAGGKKHTFDEIAMDEAGCGYDSDFDGGTISRV